MTPDEVIEALLSVMAIDPVGAECPFCGRPVGHPCVVRPHPERITAARNRARWALRNLTGTYP